MLEHTLDIRPGHRRPAPRSSDQWEGGDVVGKHHQQHEREYVVGDWVDDYDDLVQHLGPAALREVPGQRSQDQPQEPRQDGSGSQQPYGPR